MAGANAQRFMEALQEIERTGDVEPLVSMFGDRAELRNLSGKEPARGVDGARQFWGDYLGAFRQVRSNFSRAVEAEGVVVLEWTSSATLANGKEIEYPGVSVIEWEGDQVRSFRTYYDSAAFVAQPVNAGGGEAIEGQPAPPDDKADLPAYSAYM